MDAQAGMLAQLFGRSMVLGPEREVSGVWPEERDRGARVAVPVDDALEHAGDEGGREDAPQGAEGHPRLVAVGSTSAILEGPSSVIRSARRAARESRNTGCFETMKFFRLGRLDFPAQVAVSPATC